MKGLKNAPRKRANVLLLSALLLALAGCTSLPEQHATSVEPATVEIDAPSEEASSAKATDTTIIEATSEQVSEADVHLAEEIREPVPEPETGKPDPVVAISHQADTRAVNSGDTEPPTNESRPLEPAQAGAQTSVEIPKAQQPTEQSPQATPKPPVEVKAAAKPAPELKIPPVPAAPVQSVDTTPRAQVSVPQVAPLDLDSLENRLRKTKAIGLFTKLELKGQVEDLVEEVDRYHRSKSNLSLEQLEEHFDLLVMKLLVLVQDGDPVLSKEIATARPTLWTKLSDPVQFSSIKGP